MLTPEQHVETCRIKEELDFSVDKLVRVISRKDICGRYEDDNGAKIDIVLYEHKGRFFVTDEMIAPVHMEFYTPKYDVTKFVEQRKCFACILGLRELCTCDQLYRLH